MEGALLHIAGPTDSGWRVIEAWDSEEPQRRFQEAWLRLHAEGLPVRDIGRLLGVSYQRAAKLLSGASGAGT
jgi:hypothetical protein